MQLYEFVHPCDHSVVRELVPPLNVGQERHVKVEHKEFQSYDNLITGARKCNLSLGNDDRPTDQLSYQPTDRPTDGQTGKLNFQKIRIQYVKLAATDRS